ncbi:MAG: hypothetical protein ACI8UO_001275 [Verrucomicrobiales bacterium]|jgi:hypothetical protein
MKLLSFALAATFLAFSANAQDSDKSKPAHLFILSGQSNMAGMNPKAGFEQEATKLFADGEVAYIKVARGGRPIRDWVTEWNEIATKHGIDAKAARGKGKEDGGPVYYEPIVEQFQQLLAKHPNPASVTFCWMQGERDAKENLSAAYADSMKQLIANLRRDLKQPEMKFVIGRLSDFGKGESAEWTAVREAQVAVANDDPLGSWVDCDDLNNKEKDDRKWDDLHYTKEGYTVLGQRYARQARALFLGEKPAENGQPE